MLLYCHASPEAVKFEIVGVFNALSALDFAAVVNNGITALVHAHKLVGRIFLFLAFLQNRSP